MTAPEERDTEYGAGLIEALAEVRAWKRAEVALECAWADPDDAPELTEEFFEQAEIRRGDQVIRSAKRKD